ncbi:MAG: hypothetical protein DI570_08915 [Phenylobacterium zucineum]|nr:MAG: hypothetical protein DI570_08915 [Phenylobacterium zucineum]
MTASTSGAPGPERTPDGRYIVVDGRLWRATNPHIPAVARESLTRELMEARRAVRTAGLSEDPVALRLARARVHAAKVALGERGPVWWTDGAPDLNRRLVANSPYARH